MNQEILTKPTGAAPLFFIAATGILSHGWATLGGAHDIKVLFAIAPITGVILILSEILLASLLIAGALLHGRRIQLAARVAAFAAIPVMLFATNLGQWLRWTTTHKTVQFLGSIEFQFLMVITVLYLGLLGSERNRAAIKTTSQHHPYRAFPPQKSIKSHMRAA